jgi:hypothetical protein
MKIIEKIEPKKLAVVKTCLQNLTGFTTAQHHISNQT